MGKIEGLALLGGVVGAYTYFQISESSQPKDSNCSYLAPVSTDVLAVAAGAIVAYKGTVLKEPVLTFVGAAVLGIHFFQFNHYKNSRNGK